MCVHFHEVGLNEPGVTTKITQIYKNIICSLKISPFEIKSSTNLNGR